MKRTIKFRGRDMTGHFVFGLLTKKRIRSSGEIRFAIATGNCSAAETIPVNENSIAQLVGFDCDGNEVYEGDVVKAENDDVGFYKSDIRFEAGRFHFGIFSLTDFSSNELEIISHADDYFGHVND